MKIVVDRGFNNILTKIDFYRNGKKTASCPMEKNYIELDANVGDQITVKLRRGVSLALEIASVTCREQTEVFYIGPSMMCKTWELASFKIFPYLSLLCLVMKSVFQSNGDNWFCAALVTLTALSLMGLQFGLMISSVRRRLFKSFKL